MRLANKRRHAPYAALSRPNSRPLSALLLAVWLVTAAPAQQPARTTPQQQREEDDVVRITTDLVQVDAVVTDGGGRPVTDLKPEEVQIYEDGRPRKVTHFSYVAGGAVAPARPARPAPSTRGGVPPSVLRPEEVRRTVALVVDDLGLSFQSIHFVRRALRKFVDEQMRDGDLVAVIRTSGGVGALQQFTADRRRLYAAIEGVKWYGGRSGAGPVAPIEPPKPGPLGPVVDAKNVELERFREDLLAVGTLGAIGHVVRGLREMPGRKSVLVISDGFRLSDDDNPERTSRVGLRLRQLVDEAGRASVVIHTMSASGLQALSMSAADSLADGGSLSGARTPDKMAELIPGRSAASFATQSGLLLLAEGTGGVAVRNTNDLSAGIRQALDDQKGYYLIGFRPDQSTFDPKTGGRLFHRLSLKITRPGKFNVRMRKGFFGSPDAEAAPQPRTPQGQITGALLSPFGADGVRVQLTSLFANDAGHGSFTRSLLYVDANDLTFTEEPDGWRRATFDVVAVTFDESGNVVDQLSRTDALRLRGEGYRRVMQNGFVYHLIFPVKKPGAYQLRAALRDHDSERVGSAGQFVEIPDLKKGRLALSGLVVSAAASGPQADGPGEDDGREADPQAGEAVRHFKQGALMRYGFVIYNARLDKVTRAPRLEVQARLFRGGQPVFTGRVQPFTLNNPPDLSRLAAGGAVTLGADMPPGEYLLQVTVNDLLADEKHRTATQWMDFEIVK